MEELLVGFQLELFFIIIIARIARGVMNEQINELLLKMTIYQKRLDLD